MQNGNLPTIVKPKREIQFGSMAKVEGYLLEMMEKVRENPAFIPQADCVTQIAARLIDVRKTEIEEAKLIVKLH